MIVCGLPASPHDLVHESDARRRLLRELRLEPCAAPWRFAYRHGIYVDEVLRAAYGATVDECVEV